MHCVKMGAAVAVLFLMATPQTQGAIIQFDILGRSGAGLLQGNENPGTTPVVATEGFGGEIGPTGITFDDVSKELTIMVGWGSTQGFGTGNLTGVVSAGHLHGSAGFTMNAGVIQPLTITDNSANNGVVNTMITLNADQEQNLLAEQTYLNFHTAANGGGEIRGNLVVASAVPEPTSLVAGLAVLGGVITRRKYRRKSASK